jgi:hypothetical protein
VAHRLSGRGFVGSAIVGVGGFGVWYFGRKVDEARDAKSEIDRRQLSEQLSDLQVGNRSLVDGNQALLKRLEPFERLARERFPAAPPEEAMEKLRRELSEVRGLATRDVPKPLDVSVRAQVVSNLKKLSNRPEFVGLHFLSAGSRNSPELIAQIEAIMPDAGLPYQIVDMAGMSAGLPAWTAYSVDHGPTAEAAAHQFAEALAPFLGNPQRFNAVQGLARGRFDVTIAGQPDFKPNGSVTIR